MCVQRGDFILIENQYIKIKVNRKTRKQYEEKGYNINEDTKTVKVLCDDLSKGSHSKVKVKCDFCGKVKDVVWKDYYSYSKNNDKYACSKCRQTKTSQNNLVERQEKLYSSAIAFCEEKGYRLLSNKKDIKNSNTIVDYICPYHGVKHTKIYALVLKHGCDQCKIKEQKLNIDRLNKIFSERHIKCLNLEQYTDSTTKNLIVVCPECGEEFITSYNSLMSVSQQRCPTCSKSESQGEYRIRKYLDSYNINYIQEHSFQGCSYKHILFFDFYIPDMNIAIEYDGIQHFEPVLINGISKKESLNNFKESKIRDSIKDNYCKSNNIFLLRISYKDFNKIEEILDKYIINTHEDIV